MPRLPSEPIVGLFDERPPSGNLTAEGVRNEQPGALGVPPQDWPLVSVLVRRAPHAPTEHDEGRPSVPDGTSGAVPSDCRQNPRDTPSCGFRYTRYTALYRCGEAFGV